MLSHALPPWPRHEYGERQGAGKRKWRKCIHVRGLGVWNGENCLTHLHTVTMLMNLCVTITIRTDQILDGWFKVSYEAFIKIYIHTDQFILISHKIWLPRSNWGGNALIIQLLPKMIIIKMDNSGKNCLRFKPQLSVLTDPCNFPVKEKIENHSV